MHDNFYFSFLENIDEIVSTRSVNIMEGDLIVAEFFFLVAVGHHQVVAKAVGQATTRSLGRVPPPEGRSLLTGMPS